MFKSHEYVLCHEPLTLSLSHKYIHENVLCHDYLTMSSSHKRFLCHEALICLNRINMSLCYDHYTILKRKSFATLTKMLVPFFGPQQSLSDNAGDKSLYLPCIQHKNQNGVAYGCRAATIILRQPPILKSHGYNTSHVMQKIFF